MTWMYLQVITECGGAVASASNESPAPAMAFEEENKEQMVELDPL